MSKKRGARKEQHFEEDVRFTREEPRRRALTPVRGLNPKQELLLNQFKTSQAVFAIGPAGTGKTYLAASFAAQRLKEGEIERIIVTRPNVEVGEEMGHLPGTLEEKYAPFIAPFRDALIERLGKGDYECCLKNGKIVPEPLGFMRGKTFNDAVVILDEAQNATCEQMKMFLTRIGRNCLVIVDGDPEQCDIPGDSGLLDAIRRLRNVEGFSVVEFVEDEIVRSGMVREVIKAYRRKV